MPDTFLIWGGGGHGRVIADLVRALGNRVLGFVDADPDKLGSVVDADGGTVVLSQEAFLRLARTGGALPAGAVALAIGANHVRLQGLQALHGISVPPLVHPSATVSPSARLGEGSVVLASAVINAEASVGRGVIVNTGAIVEHDCAVGDGVHISPGATVCGGVQIGEGSWICAGATVIPGVRLGRWTIVGAGAAVLGDVADGATVVGVPAKPVRERNE